MPVEQLTYAQIAERLGVSSEAARAIVKRHRLPRSRGNDGKTLVAVDLEEVRHKPLPARSPRGHQPVTDVVATLKARVAQLEAELAAEQQRSAGHRADYERERDRADRMVTTQDRLVAELEALRALLEAARQPARPVTPRTLREWWRWLRSTGCFAGAGLLLALATVAAGAQQEQQQQRECFTVVMNHSTILLDQCTGKTWQLIVVTLSGGRTTTRWFPITVETTEAVIGLPLESGGGER